MGFITSGSGTGTPPAWTDPPQHSDPTPGPAFPGFNTQANLQPPAAQQQSGLGQHPAWSQMAQMGGAQLPDPMQRAWDQFTHARNQFRDAREQFLPLEGQERMDARPAMNEARGRFGEMKDWYSDLRNMPGDMARGIAPFGPPRQNAGPEFAPMLDVPQFPGMEHDGTVQGLLSALQQQTADRQRALSPPPPAAQPGAGQQSPWRPAHELGIPYSRDPHPGTRAGGGSPVAPGSLFYRPTYEGED